MAEGAKRVRDKETGAIINLQPGAYADPTKYEELKSGLEQPAFVLAPQPESPIVTNALNQGLNVAQTPPLPPPVAAPEIVPAAGPAIQVPDGTVDVGGLPVAEDSSVPGGMPPAPGGLAPKQIQTTTTTSPGFKPSKKTAAELAAADADMVAAAKAGTELGIAKANEDAALAQQKTLLAQAQQEADAELESRRAAALQSAKEAVAQKKKEAEEYKINPDRFFAEKGTMGRIGAAFAVALGAYASAQTGQQNYALKIIDDAIERDIMAQREEKQTKNQAVLNARAEWDDLRTTFGDEKLAKDALYIKKLTAITNQWEANVAKLGSKEAQQKGMETAALLRKELANRELQLEKEAQDKSQTTSVVTLEPTKPAGAMSHEERKFALDLANKYDSDQQTKDGREMVQNAAKVKDLVKSARAGNVEASAALKSLWARYVNGPGVLTQTDFDRAKLAGGVWDSANAKISKGLFGELTESELQAAARVEQLFKSGGNRLLATSARRAMQGAQNYGVPVPLVVVDPGERDTALRPQQADSETRATELGFSKQGQKPTTAVAKK